MSDDARWRETIRVTRGQPTSDGAGVRLNRVIGNASVSEIDPFLLLDEFASDDAADYIAGFPDHPHRGFETVTYMLAGRMRHEDNQGNGGSLVPGSVQWMTAGRGIIHSEMPEQIGGRMQGFQLWVNLPARDKMCAPRYQNIEPDAVPLATLENGASVRVIAGAFGEADGPVAGVATDPLYLDISLPAGAEVAAPIAIGHTAVVYVFDGAAEVGGSPEGGRAVPAGSLASLGDGGRVALRAGDDRARALLIAGRPLREPIERYGPFVMTTREEIMQAISDFQSGRLAQPPLRRALTPPR